MEPTDLLEDPRAWHLALGRRHEIANAALHPATVDGSLLNWTFQMIDEDLALADALLRDFRIARNGRLFAAPGTNLVCAEGPYVPLLEARYDWILTAAEGMNHPIFCNPQALVQVHVTSESISDTLDLLEDSVERGAWCILNFDMRDEVVRRFHDAFLEVVPTSLLNVLWRPVGEVIGLLAGFRKQLTLH